MRWISRSRWAGVAGRRWRRTNARRMGRYGCIASASAAGDIPASRVYSDCTAALIARASVSYCCSML